MCTSPFFPGLNPATLSHFHFGLVPCSYSGMHVSMSVRPPPKRRFLKGDGTILLVPEPEHVFTYQEGDQVVVFADDFKVRKSR